MALGLPISLMLNAASPTGDPAITHDPRRPTTKFGHVAKADDTVIGETGEQGRYVPRHEHCVDTGDKGSRLVDRARVAGRVGAHREAAPITKVDR
jgi:hypothetical protein